MQNLHTKHNQLQSFQITRSSIFMPCSNLFSMSTSRFAHRIQFLQSLPKRHNNKHNKKHNGGVDFRMCLTFEYMLLTCFQLLAIASTQRYIRYTDYMYISENKSKMLLLQIFQDIRCWIIQKNPHSHKPAHLQIEQRNCLFRCIWSFPSLL